ncbi:PirG [Mycobacterium sp. THU-M104]|uniref:PirG n=1 Tax=Mycobacterium sp. THU-M104 TaxID=3410515 RepID=UPI003B98FF1E
MPNRRRRKLSTTMSAVAALAVASPCAYFLVYEATSGSKAPEHHDFTQAAMITDLPNELVGALSQGLSQFGINMPPVPALTGGAGATPGLTSPGSTNPGLGTPGLGTPGLTSPGLTSPGLTSPGLTDPGLTPAAPGLAPAAALPATPGLPGGGLTSPGPTSPAAGLTPGLSPVGGAGEVPISAPVGLDPGTDGTYPILGDPSTLGGGTPAGSSGGGGLVNDVMQAANQLGAGQAIDLIKGMAMPAIQQQLQQGGAALPGAAGAAGALPGAAGALPGVAGALPGAAGAAAGALPAAAPPV